MYHDHDKIKIYENIINNCFSVQMIRFTTEILKIALNVVMNYLINCETSFFIYLIKIY